MIPVFRLVSAQAVLGIWIPFTGRKGRGTGRNTAYVTLLLRYGRPRRGGLRHFSSITHTVVRKGPVGAGAHR